MPNTHYAERSYSIREVGIDTARVKVMRNNEVCMYMIYKSPLDHLHRGLQGAQQKAEKIAAGHIIVSSSLHPYLNDAVSPDHALKGIANNILHVFFKLLPVLLVLRSN